MLSWDVEDACLIPFVWELMPFPSPQENKVPNIVSSGGRLRVTPVLVAQIFKFAGSCFTHLTNM